MGKYEEALERAKAGKPLDEVFPELKESEDEKIRKALLRCCDYWEKGQFSCMKAEDATAIRAYLEKQKEQKSIEDVIKNITKNIEAATKFLKSAGIMDDNGELAEMYRSEQKPLSTEETELNSIAFLEQLGYSCVPPGAEQKPAEWSEEDEEHINSIFSDFKQGVIPDEEDQEWLKNRLKSLRPQPHWKPSEEQISALEYFIRSWGESGTMSPQNSTLCAAKKLLDDLKQL